MRQGIRARAKPLRQLAAILLFGALAALPAAADGLITVTPTVLFDSPSAKSKGILILSGEYPLRQLVRLAGWRKVITRDGKQGWVAEGDIKTGKYAVVTAEQAGVHINPSSESALVFYARKDVVMEILKKTNLGFFQVLHADGEVGYVAVGDVWTNDG